jgi:hypothetical protein
MTREERIAVVKEEVRLLEQGMRLRNETSYDSLWRVQVQFKKIELQALETTAQSVQASDLKSSPYDPLIGSKPDPDTE